jgi:hypothetical protein
MKIDDSGFERVIAKIADIQQKIDAGIMNPGLYGGGAADALRGARAEIFKLQAIIRDVVEIEPSPVPERPDVA